MIELLPICDLFVQFTDVLIRTQSESVYDSLTDYNGYQNNV